MKEILTASILLIGLLASASSFMCLICLQNGHITTRTKVSLIIGVVVSLIVIVALVAFALTALPAHAMGIGAPSPAASKPDLIFVPIGMAICMLGLLTIMFGKNRAVQNVGYVVLAFGTIFSVTGGIVQNVHVDGFGIANLIQASFAFTVLLVGVLSTFHYWQGKNDKK